MLLLTSFKLLPIWINVFYVKYIFKQNTSHLWFMCRCDSPAWGPNLLNQLMTSWRATPTAGPAHAAESLIRSKRRALNGINDGMTVACMHDGGIWVRSWLHHYVWDSGKLIRTGPYNRRHNCFRGGARHTWAYPCPYPFHVVKKSFHYLNLLFLYGRYIFCDGCIEWCIG